jgi:hypothetical protein
LQSWRIRNCVSAHFKNLFIFSSKECWWKVIFSRALHQICFASDRTNKNWKMMNQSFFSFSLLCVHLLLKTEMVFKVKFLWWRKTIETKFFSFSIFLLFDLAFLTSAVSSVFLFLFLFSISGFLKVVASKDRECFLPIWLQLFVFHSRCIIPYHQRHLKMIAPAAV